MAAYMQEDGSLLGPYAFRIAIVGWVVGCSLAMQVYRDRLQASTQLAI